VKFGHSINKVKGEKKINLIINSELLVFHPDKHIHLILKLCVSSLIICGGVAERPCVRLQKTVYEQLANI
jgi:hypothetical protein